MSQKPTLDDRISITFREPNSVKSSDVARLLEEVSLAVIEATKTAESAEKSALDPALNPHEAEALFEKSTQATFKLRRLTNAAGRLEELQHERKAAEQEAVRWENYKRAEEARDNCADRIKKRYPALQKELMGLISLIAKTRLAVRQVNANLPDSLAPLGMPEGIAFDYPDSPAEKVVASARCKSQK